MRLEVGRPQPGLERGDPGEDLLRRFALAKRERRLECDDETLFRLLAGGGESAPCHLVGLDPEPPGFGEAALGQEHGREAGEVRRAVLQIRRRLQRGKERQDSSRLAKVAAVQVDRDDAVEDAQRGGGENVFLRDLLVQGERLIPAAEHVQRP